MTISVERSQDILKLLSVGLLQEENKNRKASGQINLYIKQAWEYICLVAYLHGLEVPERVSDFAIYLHEPVESWPVLGEHCLQLGLSGSILEDNALSPQFRALGEEISRSYKPNLELEDSHFRKLFDECRLANDAKSYTAIRYFLNKNPYHYDLYAIENPAWNESFNKLVSRCYESIPQACIRGTGKQRYIVTCPHCGWPLLWNQLGEARCHEDGACGELYHLSDYADYEEYRQPYQDGMIRTKEGIQRFVVAPEVSLIKLYDTLKSENFIQAELFLNLYESLVAEPDLRLAKNAWVLLSGYYVPEIIEHRSDAKALIQSLRGQIRYVKAASAWQFWLDWYQKQAEALRLYQFAQDNFAQAAGVFLRSERILAYQTLWAKQIGKAQRESSMAKAGIYHEEVKIYGKRSKSLYLRRSAGYLENAPRNDVFTRITVRGEWGKADYLGKQADFLDLLHFEGELPPIIDFLKDPTSFQNHALMPLENRELKNRKVQAGLESSDHRQIFESLSTQFAAFAKPVPILSRVIAGDRKRGVQKLQAEDKQAVFLAMPAWEIHILSSKHFTTLQKHILRTIGFSTVPANLSILPVNDMLLTDSLSGDYKREERISYIKQNYLQAKVPTGILVELMDYRKTKQQKRDPKKAIRDSMMARGRLSQFFTPKTGDESDFEHRIKNSVADLLRMMGYRYQPFYRYEASRQLPQNLDILAFWLFRLNKRNSGESTILLPVVAEVPFGHPHLRLILPSASGRSESYDSLYEGIKAITEWSVDFEDDNSIIQFFRAAIEERSSRNLSLLLVSDANLRRIFDELNDSSRECLSLYGILGANPEIRLARLRFSEDYDAPFCIPPEAKSKYQGLYAANENAGVYYSLQNVGNRHIKRRQRKLDNPENASTNPATVLIQLCNLQEADIPAEWAGLIHRLRLESSHTTIATKLPQPLHDIEAIKKFIPRYQEDFIDEDLNALGEEEE